MSRSWTPREMYYTDKILQEQMGETLRNRTFVYVNPNGERTPMESKEDLEIRAKYKELGFLFSPLPRLYRALKNHPKYRNKVLNAIENHLEKIIADDNGSDTDIIWLWYNGKLVKNFYSSEDNDIILYEYIVDKVYKLVNK